MSSQNEEPVAAALREAHEEILLDPAKVDLVGTIEPYRTVTGYVVTPVLGVIPPDLPLEPHEHEVAELFEAPLAYRLDPANQRRQSALFQGRERHYYEIVWNGAQDLGSDRGDDRQPVAAGCSGADDRRREMAPPSRDEAAARRARSRAKD